MSKNRLENMNMKIIQTEGLKLAYAFEKVKQPIDIPATRTPVGDHPEHDEV